jgi:hypothetical protein
MLSCSLWVFAAKDFFLFSKYWTFKLQLRLVRTATAARPAVNLRSALFSLEEKMTRVSDRRRFGTFACLAILLAMLASRTAEAKQPTNFSSLVGTWVSATTTAGVAKVIITDVGGALEVHPFGSCMPTLCDWGTHQAMAFSTGVGSATAVGFLLSINLGETIYLQGHLVKSATGQTLLEITSQTIFTNVRDKRIDYELTNNFRLQ